VRIAEQILELIGRPGAGEVAVPPPGEGAGYWAGGPSTLYTDDEFWLAYRLRRPVDAAVDARGYANVVARSADGVHFEVVATVSAEQFGSASLERPALVRTEDGGWRLYVSCSTRNSKHWWVESLDAADAADLADGKRTVVLPGDEHTAWKDVVVDHDERNGAWHLWACRHPLDGGDDQADRMTTWYASSPDGLDWTMQGQALGPTAGSWDARGTRITSVLELDGAHTAFYDGRASAAENWYERTGYALGSAPGLFTPAGGPTPAGHTARYLSVAQPPGGYRFYWEAARADGANELRTAYVPRPVSPSQS
jgi:hypothetical protein